MVTGMRLTEDRREKLRSLASRLKARVKGQDAAVDLVAERLLHGELGVTTSGRPKASFLFLGPTGVGKTELTLTFTNELLGPDKVVRLDMSEYQTVESMQLLLGASDADPGRVAEGYDACGGAGTLLADEFEKAHPRVRNLFLQLLDAGRLTTGRNRVLDFTPWYVVLTSNIGAQRILTLRKSKFETMERLVRLDAQRELPPELFPRIGATVVFNRLDYDVQRAVASGMIARECAALVGLGYPVEAHPATTDAVVDRGYTEHLGARPMRDAAEVLIRNALAENLLQGGEGAGVLEKAGEGTKLRLQESQGPTDA
jgi:ATP-dependent Clp protease ATP-binding subunit ClpA